ncbi:MAG: DUF3800 domain-containing protein [Candidatus Paceibacterota bacterium]|jgi:hypothetical protein|nr:DUF3800 domain-containing protein [Candidatus Paceibacterota bacterium]MDD5621048.1 DUF3800 domain-containing protein [Candidatus Paceibacterota bacterium]
MPYIFLDESGQFNKNSPEKYFIIGSFTVGNPRRTKKQFRSWQRSKFPKRMRYQSEIKFTEINISESLRLRTLKFIADLDVRIKYAYLLKENIPENYKRGDKIQTGLLYTNIISMVLDMYLPISDKEFRIFCDKRHLKGFSKHDFEVALKTGILKKLPKDSIIQIEMVDSEKDENIQIADWISGAMACYLENKPLGKDFFNILKNNIVGEGGELFKDYWKNKYY